MRRPFLILALRHKFIVPSELPKNSRPNYKSIETYFQAGGLSDDSEAHRPSSVEEHYLIIYFEALHVIISVIENRFDQPCFKAFLKLESILLKSITGEDFPDINVMCVLRNHIYCSVFLTFTLCSYFVMIIEHRLCTLHFAFLANSEH